ncbi:MAG TPA: hypothetical protein VGA66_01035, partial [Mycobacterium sp.]
VFVHSLGSYPWTIGGLEDNLTTLSVALLTRAVQAGVQPDGDFVNIRADGVALTEDTPLGAGGVFTSAFLDTDGWASAELFIATDQVSGSDGIEIEFTDDTAVGTVRGTRVYTFSADDVTIGFAVVRFPTELDGLRIRYTNGGTPQGSFFLACTLRVEQVAPQSSVEQQINATNIALMTRALLNARNDAGVYGNILRADGGGLRVAINEHEADTPIKALNNFQTNQANVGTSAVQIVGSPLTGRKTVAIKALASNNAKVYVGRSGVTTGSGFELQSSETLIMEIDDTAPGIFAIANSGTQRVCWAEIA